MPEEWASMRSTARWVLPVLVGPRTATRRERGGESFMDANVEDDRLRCKLLGKLLGLSQILAIGGRLRPRVWARRRRLWRRAVAKRRAAVTIAARSPAPPCGGGQGWGVAPHSNRGVVDARPRSACQNRRSASVALRRRVGARGVSRFCLARPPTLTRPHKGAGTDLRRLALYWYVDLGKRFQRT